MVSRGINRNKVGRGRKSQLEVENDQVGPGRGRKYSPVHTPSRLNCIRTGNVESIDEYK